MGNTCGRHAQPNGVEPFPANCNHNSGEGNRLFGKGQPCQLRTNSNAVHHCNDSNSNEDRKLRANRKSHEQLHFHNNLKSIEESNYADPSGDNADYHEFDDGFGQVLVERRDRTRDLVLEMAEHIGVSREDMMNLSFEEVQHHLDRSPCQPIVIGYLLHDFAHLREQVGEFGEQVETLCQEILDQFSDQELMEQATQLRDSVSHLRNSSMRGFAGLFHQVEAFSEQAEQFLERLLAQFSHQELIDQELMEQTSQLLDRASHIRNNTLKSAGVLLHNLRRRVETLSLQD